MNRFFFERTLACENPLPLIAETESKFDDAFRTSRFMHRPGPFIMKTTGRHVRLLLSSCFLAALGSVSQAAEIHFHERVETNGGLVRLGDLADVVSRDAEQAQRLNQIELFPAPTAGNRRTATPREIKDILFHRGVDLRGLRFAGASQVTLEPAAVDQQPPAAKTQPADPLQPAAQRRLVEMTQEAIRHFLKQYVAADEPWQIEVALTEKQAQAALEAERVVAVEGRWRPQSGDWRRWVGPQPFLCRFETPGRALQFAVQAQVLLPPAVVVAAQPVPQGTILQATHVRLQRGAAASETADVVERIEDVVGRETTRSIAAGQVLAAGMIREPLLVQQGDVVTVYVFSPGVRVRTNGRAGKPAVAAV